MTDEDRIAEVRASCEYDEERDEYDVYAHEDIRAVLNRLDYLEALKLRTEAGDKGFDTITAAVNNA